MDLMNKDYKIDEFLANFNSKHTRRAYEKDLKDFFNFLKKESVNFDAPESITISSFIKYKEYLKEKENSPSTINRKFTSVKSLWTWFLRNGKVNINPASLVKLPKVTVKTPTQALTDEEVNKILEVIGSDFYGRTHKLAIQLLLYTGMRRSELVNMKVKDLTEIGEDLVLKVTGKGQKQREVLISDNIKQEIKSYIEDLNLTEKDYLLQSSKSVKNQKPLNAGSVYRVLKKYAQKAGVLKKISPHSLRATVITKFINQGVPITEVADFAGHSSISTTQIYWKKMNGIKNSPVRKLNYN